MQPAGREAIEDKPGRTMKRNELRAQVATCRARLPGARRPPTSASCSSMRKPAGSPTISSFAQAPIRGRCRPLPTRSTRSSAPPGWSPRTARATTRPNGCCWTTWTSWCTFSPRPRASSTTWSGCGRRPRGCNLPTWRSRSANPRQEGAAEAKRAKPAKSATKSAAKTAASQAQRRLTRSRKSS